MKKKNFMTMALSLALVAVVGVGGTLAYLSASSNTVTNAFTVGSGYITDDDHHVGLWIDEQEYAYNTTAKANEATGDRTEDGNTYENLYPADTFVKDPTVSIVGGSVASYVFVKVEGVNALEEIMDGDVQVFDISGWNTNAWVKVKELDGNAAVATEGDGYYVYAGSEATDNVVDKSLVKDGEQCLLPEAVFTTVSVSGDVANMPSGNISSVKVSACAVQKAQDAQGATAAFGQLPADFVAPQDQK